MTRKPHTPKGMTAVEYPTEQVGPTQDQLLPVKLADGREFMLTYPADVLDYIATRREQREFVKKRKPGTTEHPSIPEHFAERAVVTVNECLRDLNAYSKLPVKKYMDIGCGFGATTALMAMALGATEVHLIEGRGTVLEATGYNQKLDAWNDVKMAAKMVLANVVLANIPGGTRVIPHYFDDLQDCAELRDLDLITSFRSWGHHYPTDTYAGAAALWLKPKGSLILDVRVNNVPMGKRMAPIVSQGFNRLKWVSEGTASWKSQRTLFEKAPSKQPLPDDLT